MSVDAQGDALAVWQRLEEKSGKTVIEASSRPAGGDAWQAPVTVSSTKDEASLPQVALDAHGDAVVVWLSLNGGGEYAIEASSRAGVAGAWQPPVTVRALGTMTVTEPRPDLAVDAQGDAVAVWERFEGEELIEAARRPASSATWGKPVALTKPEGGKGEPANQQVAIDAHGDAVTVWSRTNAATHDVVEAAEGSALSSTWQAPVALSLPGATVEEHPQVAADGNGAVVAVWERSNGASEVVEAASGMAGGGSWQTAVQLSASGADGSVVAGHELRLHAERGGVAADRVHAHRGGPAQRQALCGAEREAASEARETLPAHAGGRSAHASERAVGRRRDRVQRAHRHEATAAGLLQGDADGERRRLELGAGGAVVHGRALGAAHAACDLGAARRLLLDEAGDQCGEALGLILGHERAAVGDLLEACAGDRLTVKGNTAGVTVEGDMLHSSAKVTGNAGATVTGNTVAGALTVTACAGPEPFQGTRTEFVRCN